MKYPAIEHVVIAPLLTTIIWDDKTTTVVACDKEDKFDEQTGVLLCVAKKFLGSATKTMEAIEKGKQSARDNFKRFGIDRKIK
jgi:hypothetical protein